MISNLKAGEVSPPIHSDKFYYLLKLKEKKEAFIPDFENIKDKVREGFLKEKSAELAKVKIEEALKGLKSSNDFKRIAKEPHLKSDSTGTFKFGSYIEGIGVSDNFWTAARNLKEGSFEEIAQKLGLDLEKFRNDLNDEKTAKKVQQDLSDARALNLNGTPSFFVNGEKIELDSYQDLLTAVEAKLK